MYSCIQSSLQHSDYGPQRTGLVMLYGDIVLDSRWRRFLFGLWDQSAQYEPSLNCTSFRNVLEAYTAYFAVCKNSKFQVVRAQFIPTQL